MAGSSGLVGSQLVHLLSQEEHELLLVSEDPAEIGAKFPSVAAGAYAEWEHLAKGFDVFLQMDLPISPVTGKSGKLNRAAPGSSARLSSAAKRIGIPRFVQCASFRALTDRPGSPYAQSVASEYEEVLQNFGESAELIFLGRIAGSRYARRKFWHFRYPERFDFLSSEILSAIIPTTQIEDLAKFLSSPRVFGQSRTLVLTDGNAKNFTYSIWRAAVDGVFVVAVLLLAPLLLIAWIAVLIESGRPGIFSQDRVGERGSIFRCFKIRTMRTGTSLIATHKVGTDAVTRVGGFLRRFKIDELPQVWNVFRGEMSVVGPRPCLPNQHEVVRSRLAHDVIDYRPGLTGWAQACGVDMRDPDTLAILDAQYLSLRSVWFDAFVIARTLVPHRIRRDDRT